jgi:predicted RNA-binding protein YlqC (UPF0109 family)
MDRIKELVEYVAKALVSDPSQVKVKMVEKDRVVVIELNVGEDDMGRVIGKQGRIAKAIRAVVKSATANEKKRYLVEIVD